MAGAAHLALVLPRSLSPDRYVVSPATGLSILSVFQKDELWGLLIFYNLRCCFFFSPSNSTLYYFSSLLWV